jgi:hypothetical protein
VLFRRWATQVLVQYAVKGFVIDKERPKEPADFGRIQELRHINAEIRASDFNLYSLAQLRRILHKLPLNACVFHRPGNETLKVGLNAPATGSSVHLITLLKGNLYVPAQYTFCHRSRSQR